MINEIQSKKAIKIGDTLKQSLSLYKENFRLFLSIAFLGNILGFITALLSISSNKAYTWSSLITALLSSLISLWASIALIIAASNRYSHVTITLKESFGKTRGKYWRCAGVGILYFLVWVTGFLLCIIPGVYWGTIFSLAMIVVVLEKRRDVGPFRMSKELVKGSFWKVFLIGLIFTLLSSPLYVINYVILKINQNLAMFFTQICILFYMSFATILSVNLYYKLKEKRESELPHGLETLVRKGKGLGCLVAVGLVILIIILSIFWISVSIKFFKTERGSQISKNNTLSERLISGDNKTRSQAIKEFGQLDYASKGKYIDFLIKSLKSENNTTRYLAVFSLGKIGPVARKAIPDLVEALKDDNYDVRWNAINTLGHIGPTARETARALYPFLKSEQKYERASAAASLVAMGEAETHLDLIIAQLKAAIWYKDPWTRERAIEMLGNIGPVAKEAIPDIMRVAKDRDNIIRRYAIWALGRIGGRNAEILDVLVKATQDKDHDVRLNALLTLEWLYPEAKQNIQVVKNEFEYEKSRKLFDSALLFSAYDGDAKNIEALLNLGANINTKDYLTGKTALMIAAEYGRPETVKILIDRGADVNIRSDSKDVNAKIRAPFMERGIASLIMHEIMIATKQNLTLGSYEGKTALICAVESEISEIDKIEIIKLLIDNGANINIADKDSRTALMIAEKMDSQRIVKLLNENLRPKAKEQFR